MEYIDDLFGEPVGVLKYIRELTTKGIDNPEEAGKYLKKIFGMDHYYTMGCGLYDAMEADDDDKKAIVAEMAIKLEVSI